MENFICECGNENFWFFWSYVRCTKCFNEYKETWETPLFPYEHGGFGGIEPYEGPRFWIRRFDKDKNQYHNDWEHSVKLTFNKNKK